VVRAVVLASLAAGVIACGDRADTPTAATQSIGGPGQVLYLTYCQSCHGAAGRGDGPAAPALRRPPTDLTQLWRIYGTPLDRERVAEYIDGRGLLIAHGPREMPIWGEEFFEDVPETTPSVEQVKRRLIDVLVEYLETLQTERRT
jgi:mono/diheme cytochrome c family protein